MMTIEIEALVNKDILETVEAGMHHYHAEVCHYDKQDGDPCEHDVALEEVRRRLATSEKDAKELDRLRRAVRKFLRAKYDDTYSPTKDWHKRHDEGNAEAKLAELVGYEYE